MKIPTNNLSREEMHSYSSKGFLLFDVSVYDDDSMVSRDSFLATIDDILYSTNEKIIALSEIKESSIILELFDGENYSQEEIFDKISEMLSFDVTKKGVIRKTSVRYRRNF